MPELVGTGAGDEGKPSLTTEEQRARITTMAAAGLSQLKISKTIGRSRHMVKNVLAEPEIQKAVKFEKVELAVIFRDKSRDVLVHQQRGWHRRGEPTTEGRLSRDPTRQEPTVNGRCHVDSRRAGPLRSGAGDTRRPAGTSGAAPR